MKMGHIRQSDPDTFYGKVGAIPYISEFKMSKVQERQSDDSPHFMLTDAIEGHTVGMVWEKVNRNTGEIFFSMLFDHPMNDKAVNMSAFPDENERGMFNVIFSRPRGNRSKSAEKSDNYNYGTRRGTCIELVSYSLPIKTCYNQSSEPGVRIVVTAALPIKTCYNRTV